MMGPVYRYRATLIRVIDGDTFVLDVDLGFHVHRHVTVRLRDYSAPELHELGGDEAAQRAHDLMVGQTLVVQSYRDRRSFARWVCDVWLPDGRMLADAMVA